MQPGSWSTLFGVNPLRETMRATLRAAIATSADARACTERLAGKAIAFELLGERWVVRFESGVAQVEGGEAEADTTVRGSPVAVLGALLGGERHAAAVLGDGEVFEDFRASFRPHFSLPLPHAPHLAEDIGDAAHLAVRAARSALEGLLAVLRERDQPAPAAGESETAAEADALRAQVRELEERIAALEGSARNTAEESPPPAP